MIVASRPRVRPVYVADIDHFFAAGESRMSLYKALNGPAVKNDTKGGDIVSPLPPALVHVSLRQRHKLVEDRPAAAQTAGGLMIRAELFQTRQGRKVTDGGHHLPPAGLVRHQHREQTRGDGRADHAARSPTPST